MLTKVTRVRKAPYAIGNFNHKLRKNILRHTQTTVLGNGDRVYDIPIEHPHLQQISGLKILHLSDMHARQTRSQEKKYQYYKNLAAQEYDLIFFTGDLVHDHEQDFGPVQEKFLSSLKAKLGKFACLGDNDLPFSQKVKAYLKKTGFTLLHNKTAKIKYNKIPINIINITQFPEYSVPVEDILKNVHKQDINICITHTLDSIDHSVPKIFDLILSGHFHGGEYNLGMFDGVDYLALKGEAYSINRQIKGIRFISPRTLSYINPGMQAIFHEVFPYIPRIATVKQGVAILTIK